MSAGYEYDEKCLRIYVQRVSERGRLKKYEEYVRMYKYNIKKFHVENFLFPCAVPFLTGVQ